MNHQGSCSIPSLRLAIEEDEHLTRALPELGRDHIRRLGRKHVATRQRFLGTLLSHSFERRRPHALDPDADSFSQAYLVRGLRTSRRRGALTPFLAPFFSYEEGNRGYSRDDGVTKAYLIKPHVLEALTETYKSNEPVPVNSQGETPYFDPALHSLGIMVPSTLKVSMEEVEGAIARLRKWIALTGPHFPLDQAKWEGMTLNEALQIALACRKWILSHGGLPNAYVEQANGRMGPLEGALHVITLPGILRRLLLHRSGLVDFDIASCHWALLQSLARELGIDTPKIQMYVKAKHDCHSRWAYLAGRGSDTSGFKALAVSWLSGATLTESSRASGTRLVGASAIQALRADPYTMQLYQEVRDTLRKVIRETEEVTTDGRHSVAVNAVGSPLLLKGSSADWGRRCSHLLTGYEQFAIRTICSQVRGLRAIIYDGFIADPQEIEPLERAVREASQRELGLTLTLSLKKKDFSDPLPDPSGDDEDFL